MLSQTIQTVIGQVAPIIGAGIFGFLVKEVIPIGSAVIDLLSKKKEVIALQVGTEKYNSNLAIAKNVWNLVDEEFRITPALTKTIESAQKLFSEKILKVIPWLTSDDIEHLRQAVAGEINKGKAAIIAPIGGNTSNAVQTNCKKFETHL